MNDSDDLTSDKARRAPDGLSSISGRPQSLDARSGVITIERKVKSLPTLATLGLATYLITNRAMQSGIVIPGPISLHPSDVVLVTTIVLAAVRFVINRPAFPRGSPAILGLVLILFLSWSPLITATDMTAHEARTFDQGLVYLFLYAGLFVVAYQAGTRRREVRVVIHSVFFASAVQALLALIENAQRAPVTALDELWLAVGFRLDPRGNATIAEDLITRLTGELRASATAPHPLVLSAILGVSALATLAFALHSTGTRRRMTYGVLAVIQVAGVATTSSRTGYLMLAVGGGLLALGLFPRPLRLVNFLMGGTALLGLVGLVAPGASRIVLNLATFESNDQNIDVRLERFQLLPDLVQRRPFVGAGYLTNDVQLYLWDNSYNQMLVETGMIGVTLTTAFLLSLLVVLWVPATRVTPSIAALSGVLGVLGLLLGAATFDAWHFDQYLPMCLALAGLGLGSIQRDKVRPSGALFMSGP